MRFRRAALGMAISCAACGISVVGVDPLDAGGASAVDGSVSSFEGGASADGAVLPGTDSGGVPGVDASPVTIASAGTVASPTGNAQQTHLVYAENTRRWWLFTITSDAASSLQAWSSPDFRTWTAAMNLALPKPHGGQGSNFSVAYSSIAGHDIVHLEVGLAGTLPERTHYHARAAIEGSSIKWSALTGVSTVSDDRLDDPEGAVTVITPSGFVTDFTGWTVYGASAVGNQDAFTSQSADNGIAEWTSGFSGRTDIASVTHIINARAAFSIGGETLFALWESGDAEPDPSNVRSARNSSGTWTNGSPVFGTETKFGVNDWGGVALGPTDVHAIRFTTAFEHRRWDGTWKDGNEVPVVAGVKKNSGVVVLHDASRVLLAVIAGDSSVQMTSWTLGAWSAWNVVAPPSAGRSSLSGWWSPSAGTGLVWTEAAHVAGVRVP